MLAPSTPPSPYDGATSPSRNPRRGGVTRRGLQPASSSARCPSALLLAQLVDEPDQLDDGLVVLGIDLDEFAVLAVRQLVEGGLGLGRRVVEGLDDRRLQVGRQVGQEGKRRIGDQVR